MTNQNDGNTECPQRPDQEHPQQVDAQQLQQGDTAQPERFTLKCPHCAQDYALSEELLTLTQSMVRCGQCMKAFDPELARTYSHYINEPRNHQLPLTTLSVNEAGEQLLSVERIRSLTRPLGQSSGKHPGYQTDTNNNTQALATNLHPGFDNERIEPSLPEYRDDDIPDLSTLSLDPDALETSHKNKPITHQQTQNNSLGAWLSYCVGISLCALLFLTLLIQLEIIGSKNQKSALLIALCDLIKCSTDHSGFSIEYTSIHSAASSSPDSEAIQSNVLTLESVIKNTSDTALAHPHLDLRFMDANQRITAHRIFLPAEYLSPSAPDDVASGSLFTATLEIADPGIAIPAYELRTMAE